MKNKERKLFPIESIKKIDSIGYDMILLRQIILFILGNYRESFLAP